MMRSRGVPGRTERAGLLAVALCLCAVLEGCATAAQPAGLPPLPEGTLAVGPASTDVPPALPTAANWVGAAIGTPDPATQGDVAQSDRAVAVVNGQAISYAEFEAQVSQAQVLFMQQPGFDPSPDSPAGEASRQALARFRESYLEVMIDQVLVEQAAEGLGITISEADIDAEVARLRGEDAAQFAQWLQASGLSEETLRSRLRQEMVTRAVRDAVTADTPRTQPHIHVRHILLADEAAAQEALRRLDAGEAFEDVARALSEDAATREAGGDLGYLPRGVMPPAFEATAFALLPGEVSGVVTSETGLHVIQVLAVDPGRAVPDAYWPAVQQYAFEQWLRALREQAVIERPGVTTP
jgi:parvulin-like peptidyl-prolyl isomerase